MKVCHKRKLQFESFEPRNLLTLDLVADIGSAGLPSFPRDFRVVEGGVQFTATTPTPSRYETDGTEAGTVLVAEEAPPVFEDVIQIGAREYSIAPDRRSVLITEDGEQFALETDFERLLQLFELDGNLYAYALGTRHTNEIFVLDAEEDEFTRLRSTATALDLTVVGDRAYFVRGPSLWNVTGMQSSLVAAFPRVDRLSILGSAGDGVLVRRTLGNDSVRQQFWHFGGTAEGMTLLLETDGNQIVSHATSFLDAIWFVIADTTRNGADASELWSTRPVGQPQLVFDQLPEDVGFIRALAGRLHLRGGGGEYWTSDGTAAGTRSLGVTLMSQQADGIAALPDSQVVFAGANEGRDWELWISDGTPAGTRELVDLQPQTVSAGFLALEGGQYFRSHGDYWLFAAYNGVYAYHVGTNEVVEVLNLAPPPDRSLWRDVNVHDMRVFGDTAYVFVSSTESRIEHYELWAIDGELSTERLWTAESANPVRHGVFRDVFSSDQKLYFAFVRRNVTQLWETGSAIGSSRLVDEFVPSAPRQLLHHRGKVYYNVLLGGGLYEIRALDLATAEISVSLQHRSHASVDLYARGEYVFFATSGGVFRTYGTSESTERISDFPVDALHAADDRLYFSAHTDGHLLIGTVEPDGARVLLREEGELFDLQVHGRELLGWRLSPERRGWSIVRTDGTEAGTGTLADLAFLQGSRAEDRSILRIGDLTYFAFRGLEVGEEVWRSDGTAEGTSVVRDIAPGLAGSDPHLEIAWQNRLFFTTDDGRAMWSSDGTADGTRRLADLDSTATRGSSRFLGLNDELLFRFIPAARSRVYRTDGTPEGTAELAASIDVVIDDFTFYGQESIISLGDGALLIASDGVRGNELWRYSPDSNGSEDPIGPDAARADLDGDGTVGFTDFLMLSADFGREDEELASDLNMDGEVDFDDYLLLAGAFGRDTR